MPYLITQVFGDIFCFLWIVKYEEAMQKCLDVWS